MNWIILLLHIIIVFEVRLLRTHGMAHMPMFVQW